MTLKTEPFWHQHRARFGEEYVCLKCGKIRPEKCDDCPDCGGVMCVRITSKVF